MKYEALDLFAGDGGWSADLIGNELWNVTRAEIGTRRTAELHADVLDFRADPETRELVYGDRRFGPFDLVLASPPCERFSIASRGIQWEPVERGFVPRTVEAIRGLELAMHTLYLLHVLAPKAAIMENPRGLMRKILPVAPSRTVWYCRYGDQRAKPTDLWTFGGAASYYYEPECSNKREGVPHPCHHERARRGAKTGTQGSGDYWEKSLVPLELSRSVRLQTEALLRGELEPAVFAPLHEQGALDTSG